MNTSEILIGGIVKLKSGGPVLTLVNQTPYTNIFGYFDSNQVYHTMEIPNRKECDNAFKDIFE